MGTQSPTRCAVGFRLPLALLVAFVSFSIPGRADLPQPAGNQLDPAALKKLSLEELSQIEVTTPSREPEKAFDTPAAVFVITGDDIRRSGVTSIPEALRMAPGVEVARIDANHWSVGIRGFGSRLTRDVLVLVDGRTVYTPLFDGTYWEVQDTLLEDVDRIEVIRGPGGTIWGPNAVNGVIDVITKSSKDTHGAFVSAGGGNEEQGFVNARYGGGDGKNFDYRLYGKSFTRGPEDHANGQNFDDWRSVQGGFRMDWSGASRGNFTLQGDIYDEVAGESVQAETYTAPYSRVVNANVLLSGGNVLGRWEKKIREGNDIQLQVYYDRTSRLEPILGEVRNTADVDFIQHLLLRGRQKVSWGLGARVDPVRDTEIVSGVAFTSPNRVDYLLTAFIEDEIGLVKDRLSLTLGTKLLRTNFTGKVSPQPSARLALTPDGRQTLWAAFTHAIRTPSDSEENFNLLGYAGTIAGLPFFARFNANANFAPEQLNGSELGYRRLLGKKVYVDLAGFYNHYHNLFSEDITGAPFVETDPGPVHLLEPGEVGNGLLATTKGIEIAPEWRPTSFWRLTGSYSYLHMDVYKAPGSTDFGSAPAIQGSSPGHQIMVQSAFDLSKVLKLDLNFRHISALPGQSPAAVPAYSTADIRLAWQLNRQIELSFVGMNLLQPSHFEDGGDPFVLVGIERSGYAQIAWRR